MRQIPSIDADLQEAVFDVNKRGYWERAAFSRELIYKGTRGMAHAVLAGDAMDRNRDQVESPRRFMARWSIAPGFHGGLRLPYQALKENGVFTGVDPASYGSGDWETVEVELFREMEGTRQHEKLRDQTSNSILRGRELEGRTWDVHDVLSDAQMLPALECGLRYMREAIDDYHAASDELPGYVRYIGDHLSRYYEDRVIKTLMNRHRPVVDALLRTAYRPE